ncbi:hypothetical protein J2Y02_002782 [Neobacillus drentensis]|nr:hypothetical protein [Neobacillus drentensis]
MKREKWSYEFSLILSLISFLVSIISYLIIFQYLDYRMNIIRVMSFTTFEKISLPLSVISLVFGVICTYRNRKYSKVGTIFSIIGVIISSLTFLGLIGMMVFNGM